MKKLLLILFISFSFTAFAFSFSIIPLPCGDDLDQDDCIKSPQGEIVNDLREGVWIWFDNYNRMVLKGNYVNGLEEGNWTQRTYKGSSNIPSIYDTTEKNYKNGELDGKWVRWISSEGFNNVHKIQDIKQKIRLNKALVLALKKAINENSTYPAYTPYSLEQLQEQKRLLEIELSNFQTPRIIAEGNYINGKKEGTWTWWKRDIRQIRNKEIYKDGVLIEEQWF